MKKIVITLVMLSLLAGWPPLKASAQAPEPCEVEYIVQSGDWLSKIAEKYYGDSLAFDQIIETANASGSDAYANIANPNLIEPGWVLCLPAADVVAQLVQTAQNAPPGLSPQELANATYKSQYTASGTVTLQNGRYSEPVAPDSASEITVRMTRHLTYGDMNGQSAAAIVLVSNPGGSGNFYDLHVMTYQNEQTVNPAATFLGDRIQINEVKIENSLIVVDMVQAGPNDPVCCPSEHVIKTFEWQKDQLVETSSQVVEAGSPTEIIPFDPASMPPNPNQTTLNAACQPSNLVPGAYQCATETGGILDPCFVLEGSNLVCNPNPVFGSYTVVVATNPLPLPLPAQNTPFYLQLEGNYPPCRISGEPAKQIEGLTVTYNCDAPGAWLVGDLDTSQPTWTTQIIITDSSGATITSGPTPANVNRAWVY